MFVNPCLTATWNTQALSAMTGSALASAPTVQTIPSCSVSVTGCGSVTYSLNQTLSFVTLNIAAMTITVQSLSLTDVGTYYLGLIATLASYTTLTETLSFTVSISSCVVTSLTLISGAFNAALTTTINIFDTTGLQLAIPTYKQTP